MGILSFISRQSSKNVSVIKLFPLKGKQKNASSNNSTMQACVKIFFDHLDNAKAF